MCVLQTHLFYQEFYLIYITVKFAFKERLKISLFLPVHRLLALSSGISIALPEHQFSCLIVYSAVGGGKKKKTNTTCKS